MIPQYFKGDANEIKMDTVGSEIMDISGHALDQFFDEGFLAADFLLMLYDEGRMPFSDRIPREAFIAFLVECIANANFIGTYESYIFLIQSIFGADSIIFFEETDPGVLTMTVSASNSVTFEWVGREFNGVSYDSIEMVDDTGDRLAFSGFPGIDSEAELQQLLAEFIPAGIWADISLITFSAPFFLVDDGGDFTIVDHLGNDIIFFEL